MIELDYELGYFALVGLEFRKKSVHLISGILRNLKKLIFI
jgi:hypothetical protein